MVGPLPRRIRVSSRAVGERETVYVFVYEDLAEMRRSADAFNGTDNQEAFGVTQCYTDEDMRATCVLVRLAQAHLGTEVIVHEMHHASTALYGAHVGDRIRRRAHLNHCNEPFAHLHSELTGRLVNQLYRYGYLLGQREMSQP